MKDNKVLTNCVSHIWPRPRLTYIQMFCCCFFWWPKAFFIFVYTVPYFPLGVLYPYHLHLESIRPGLVQGCKAPQWCGLGLFASHFGVRSSPLNMACTPSAPIRTQTHNRTIGHSRATPSLLIGVVQYFSHAQTCGGQLPTLVITACQHPWA